MTQTTKGAVLPGDAAGDLVSLIDPQPLVRTGRNWTAWIGPVISLMVLGAVLYQMRQLDYHEIVAMVPANPAFWIAFLLYYCASPISEWIIFHRLWSIPPDGFGALLRKLVSNEILLGYLGEVYFYAWARRHGRITAAPFGAIKDVTILSALAGNAVTLAMLLLAAPLLGQLHLGIEPRTFVISVGVVLLTSLAAMLLRNRLFSLPRNELWFVTFIHLARIGATIGLSAFMWHLILPEVEISWWFLLATLRQLLSRLPLLPNKDLVFVAVAAFLVGRDTQVDALMAMMASLILAAHLLVGGVLGLSDLIRRAA